ncbi:MAG: RNA methyltransferase [Chitinophagales bacterium]|nr:RNA methyltransferase [Chitinophagales bacterium]MDW8394389.1 RNA methyltransferase [Chitinophagales bacterium]
MRKLTTAELNRPAVEQLQQLPRIPLVLLLDNIRSAFNVGSIFRTADAFRVERVVLCGITATPPHREVLKTALGSTGSVPWQYEADAVGAAGRLKQQGYRMVAVEQTDKSRNLQEFLPDGRPLVLIFGNEVRGIGPVLQLADEAVQIPQWGFKHSLNVAVAAGIVLWEICRKCGWIGEG